MLSPFWAVLAAWLAVAPDAPMPAQVCESLAAGKEHYCDVAVSIAEAAERAPIWDRPGGKEATALALAAIAKHESGVQRAVAVCKILGDDGDRVPTVSMFQLKKGKAWWGYTQPELCDINQVAAADAALKTLALHKRGAWSIDFLFRGYASGNGGVQSRAAREISSIWYVYMRRINLDPNAFQKETY